MEEVKTPEQLAEEYAAKEGKPWGCEQYFLAGYQAAKDQLADADKVMPQWISVKDRLPENSVGWTTVYGCILSRWAVQPGFYTKDSGVWVSRFVDQHEDYHNYLPFESVSHWMPLPKPPKE